ncbi:DNA internalization-related competence protein ComEC/Rec2 [Rubrivirga marina]|uniref:DNA internalization-related competence protein ComEC/Rec2 n=1 Tax=Rubrivirga marina TaxID=1196024 RepID=A0A271J536_9BACT|nr:DNA internalization-related competence protein ComEC/Rec2 [Rubrivirga marina]
MAALVAGGIGLGRLVSGVDPMTWAVGGLAVVSLAVGYVVVTRRRLVSLGPVALALAVGGAALTLGAARDAASRTARPDGIERIAEAAWEADSLGDRAPITVWATVLDAPEATWSIRFTAAVDSAARGDTHGVVRGRVLVSLLVGDAGAVYPVLRPGDRVRLTGRLERLPRRRNPAQFDYGAYLRRQGVGAMLTVESEADAAFLAPSRQPTDRIANGVRVHIETALARHVQDAEVRALLRALLLADRSGIEAGTLDAFRETGLMHLLAVSGLHVGLVGLTLYVLLKPLLGRLGVRRRRLEAARAIATLAVLAVYVVVAGASVSIVRAFVMVALVIAGRALDRRSDTLNALGIAAFLLLVHRPAALFDVGFQLSFGAVFALVTLTPLLTSAVPERVRQSKSGTFVVGSIVTSVAATIGTAPALLYHFGRLPIGGLVLNVVAIPLTAATLGAGLGCALTAWVPPLAATFGALATATGGLLLGTTEAGADTLGGIAYDGFLDSASVLIALLLGIAIMALWRRPVARTRLALAALGCLAIGTWTGFATGDGRPALDAVFLDVGQGDATLLSTPGGRHVLIDAGLKSPYVDEGKRTILPHLERFGIARLDALVLTHADADHVGGARSVLEHAEVGRLIVNGQDGTTDLWTSVLHVADSLGVPVQAVKAGDTLAVDPAIRLRVLGPGGPMDSPNDASVVLLAEYGATRWLLTGDAEVAGEAALVRRFGEHLEVDVVKVGHHGSRTSSTPALVRAARQPEFAVVSVARRNRYGLPNEEPIARWTAAGAAVLHTSTEGAVWLRSNGEAVERIDWRRE